jgi:hypothetical protein
MSFIRSGSESFRPTTFRVGNPQTKVIEIVRIICACNAKKKYKMQLLELCKTFAVFRETVQTSSI